MSSPKPDVKQTDCNICDEEYDTKDRKVVRAACHHELCLRCATDVVVRNKRFICPECTVEDKKLSAELRPVSAPASASGSGSATASKVSASASASSSASGEEGAPSTDDNASAPDHCRACTSCDSVGVQFCTTCRVAFCKRSAQESHRGPGFSDHKFVATKDQTIDICAIHKAPFFYYCKECERLLCTVCERRHEKDAKTKDHQSDEVCIAHTHVLAKLAKLAEKLGGFEALQTAQSRSDEAAILTLRKAVEACLAVIAEEAARKHAGVRERERALKEEVTTLAAEIIKQLQTRSANGERVRGDLKDAADAIDALSSCFNLVVLRDASKVVQNCDGAASAHDAVQAQRAVGVDVKLVVRDRETLFADAPKPFAAHHLRTEESEARKAAAEAKAEAEAKAAAKAKADAKAAADAKIAADAKAAAEAKAKADAAAQPAAAPAAAAPAPAAAAAAPAAAPAASTPAPAPAAAAAPK